MKTNPVYFIGMGDYCEFLSAKERSTMVGMELVLHDTTVDRIRDLWNEVIEDFYSQIEFMKGSVLGMVEGNHHVLFPTGVSSTQYMCEKLQCPYLGAITLMRFSVSVAKTNNLFVDICAHHGKGAARLLGSSLNTVAQMADMAQAQIYLMGHDHKKGAVEAAQLRLSENRRAGRLDVKQEKILFARTGSFYTGYQANKGTYVSKLALRPSSLGAIKIKLTPRKKTWREKGARKTKTWLDLDWGTL